MENLFVTDQQKNTIKGVLIGSRTIDGVEIKSIDIHAIERMIERGFGASQIRNVYETAEPKKGNIYGRNVYEKNGVRVIININEGVIISVIRLKHRG